MKALGRITAVLAVTALLVVGTAQAEVVQRGNLRVKVGAELSPQRLPRVGTAPIAVTVGGRIATTDGSLPPQLETLRIEFNRHGHLETAGLPRCRESQIQPASTARALAACRAALVGQGDFSVEVVLGTQEPYPTKGRLLVFNGTYKGKPALLGQIYSSHPFANSFVIPFAVGNLPRGRFGTVLTAKLPRAFTNWASSPASPCGSVVTTSTKAVATASSAPGVRRRRDSPAPRSPWPTRASASPPRTSA